ncbi:MAG: polysaccharide pyruvyl transferase family protein [Clostridia bacterium]|nr:polysaccharide pyruvyl transferase family protein [Clostridia bacterium]
MKIGILTYHRSINYGAYLQSYCLASALKEKTGFNVEIIDYSMPEAEWWYVRNLISKNPFEIFRRLSRYRTFKKSLQLLPLSEQKLITGKMERVIDFLNSHYAAIIVGSDEVWKINKIRCFPNIYWLPSGLNCKKASYAASANRTDFDLLSPSVKENIKRYLADYDLISVRDSNTLNQIQRLLPEFKVMRSADPTFVFDFDPGKAREAVSLINKKYGIDDGRPVLGLLTNSREIGSEISKRYGREFNIIAMSGSNPFANRYLYNITPFEWAAMFSCMSLCITDLFHGTVFSIKNQVPFASFDRSAVYQKYESKILDLLKRNNLEEHYFFTKDPSFDWKKTITRIDNIVSSCAIEKMKAAVVNERNTFHEYIESIKKLFERETSN